jgi:hypothetical protein
MKKTRGTNKAERQGEDMLPEYSFDYGKAKHNRFAGRMKSGSRVVVIEPAVAEVFSTPESVNAVLRALIRTMPRSSSDQASR